MARRPAAGGMADVDMGTADFIITGGKIFCGLRQGFAEAVAIAGERIVATGAAADIADLTKEKLDAEREEADEFSTAEDSDGDGFYDYEEELTGHDPNDPDSKPTQEEVDAAEAAERL